MHWSVMRRPSTSRTRLQPPAGAASPAWTTRDTQGRVAAPAPASCRGPSAPRWHSVQSSASIVCQADRTASPRFLYCQASLPAMRAGGGCRSGRPPTAQAARRSPPCRSMPPMHHREPPTGQGARPAPRSHLPPPHRRTPASPPRAPPPRAPSAPQTPASPTGPHPSPTAAATTARSHPASPAPPPSAAFPRQPHRLLSLSARAWRGPPGSPQPRHAATPPRPQAVTRPSHPRAPRRHTRQQRLLPPP
mmetsp:Transcript_14398/g.42867  ORF Transcript_14398/g.42867 Transcript_14398/m.42867 type:complete len:248 (+) Transcript_14398:112-855(+)